MKLVLDLDTGIDDALALALALAYAEEGHELIGVTCTYGNVTVAQSVANTRSLLQLLGRPDIPVYAGPEKPDFAVADISAFIHGSNGVGQVRLPAAGVGSDGPATQFLSTAFRDYGQDLRIIPTGPSTTIAAALKLDPALADAPIYCMAGALSVPGNISPVAEANVAQDPAATDFLLRHANQVSMVGLDVTLRTLLTYEHTTVWRGLGTRSGEVYADMVDYYIGAYEVTSPYLGGCGLHDPLAVAAAIDPTMLSWLDLNLKCDEDGRTVQDPASLNQPARNRMAIGVDAEVFVATFMDRLTSFFARG